MLHTTQQTLTQILAARTRAARWHLRITDSKAQVAKWAVGDEHTMRIAQWEQSALHHKNQVAYWKTQIDKEKEFSAWYQKWAEGKSSYVEKAAWHLKCVDKGKEYIGRREAAAKTCEYQVAILNQKMAKRKELEAYWKLQIEKSKQMAEMNERKAQELEKQAVEKIIEDKKGYFWAFGTEH